MRDGSRERSRGWSRVVTVALLALLGTRAPSLAADVSSVEQALDGAVRIDVMLHWPDMSADAEFAGSGWTRQCEPRGSGFQLVLGTAGHVVDVAALEQEARPGPHPAPRVEVVVSYRDGRQYTAGREDLRVDRAHDYAEVRVYSPIARTVLPAGGADDVWPGTSVFTIASPGLFTWAYFEGSVTALDARFVAGAPEGAWLSSVPVAPGASGAPVMTRSGLVVGFVDGFVEWPWGASASIIVTLPPQFPAPPPISLDSPRCFETEEGTHMNTLFSLVEMTGAAALALGLAAALKQLLYARGQFTADAFAIITSIAEKAVMAVEQAHGDLAGVDKKQLATDIVGEILSGLHLHAPPPLVNAAIEAAVLVLNRLSGKAA